MLFLQPHGRDEFAQAHWRDTCLRLLPLLLWAFYLLLLPLYPSQDGATHLLTGQLFFDTLLGRQPEPTFYEVNTTLFTNLPTTFCLGLLQEIGFSELWAERLWLFAIGALLFTAFQVVSRRNRQPAIVGILLLLLLESRIMHMGFWNFLLGVALGSLGYSCRKQGRMGMAGDVFFVLAVACHPMGGQFFLGLVLVETALARAPKRLLRILPHLFVLWLTTPAGAVGEITWQSFGFPDLFFSELDAMVGAGVLDVASRVGIVVVLLLWLIKSKAVKAHSEQDRTVLYSGVLLLIASSFVPVVVGDSSDIPERFLFLAAFCVFPALPLGPAPPYSRLATVLLPFLVVIQLWPTLSYTCEVAAQQDRELSLLPRAEENRSYFLGCDAYDVNFYPVILGSRPRHEIQSSRFSLARISGQSRYNPWLHVLDRWAVRGKAIHLLSHQALYEHCLLQIRLEKKAARGQVWEALKFYPRFLPFDALAGMAESCLLIHLPEDWQQTLLPRVTRSWEVEAHSERFVLLRSKLLSDGPAKNIRTGALAKLEIKPRPYVIAASGSDVVVNTHVELAHFGWRAFVLYPDMSYALAGREFVDPSEGYLDEEGRATLKRVKRPKNAVLILVPK